MLLIKVKKIIWIVGILIFILIAGFIAYKITKQQIEQITKREVERITKEKTEEITQQILGEKTAEIVESKGPEQDIARQDQSMGNLCTSLSGCFVFCKNNVGRCSNFCKTNPKHELCALPEAAKTQEWVKDVITQPLPEGASKVRLVFYTPLDTIPLTEIGAYGAHPVGHAEGLDHEWIAISNTKPFTSWADGIVVYVNTIENRIQDDTPSIVIYYGDGLWGEHMHVQKSLVQPGDIIKAGDPVGYGEKYAPGYQFAEFNVADQHRRDSVGYWYKFVKGATLVSPFDYLQEDVKLQLTEKWKKDIIDTYVLRGEETFGVVPTPWEPYLTNPILFHQENKGTLIGEWFLRSKPWTHDNVPDIVIFFTNNTKYYNKQRVVGVEEVLGKDSTKPAFSGVWEADYQNNRFIITTHDVTYYGIFELDESAPQAQLKIEYRQDSYPTGFSEQAFIYTERERISKGEETYYWQHPEDDPKNW